MNSFLPSTFVTETFIFLVNVSVALVVLITFRLVLWLSLNCGWLNPGPKDEKNPGLDWAKGSYFLNVAGLNWTGLGLAKDARWWK